MADVDMKTEDPLEREMRLAAEEAKAEQANELKV